MAALDGRQTLFNSRVHDRTIFCCEDKVDGCSGGSRLFDSVSDVLFMMIASTTIAS